MLSIKPLKNASAVLNYFSRDNYYNATEGEEKSEWWGKGATAFSLAGEVNNDDFHALLHGELPNRQQLGVMKEGLRQHRPGIDCTFSAPKSVSLVALLGGDERLITAHRNAVKTTLAEIEKNHSAYRLTQAGETTVVLSDNLTVALFHHDVSRLHDPQLHTHAVVMNVTLDETGFARALASQSHIQRTILGPLGFSDKLFALKKAYGMVYRAELAKDLRALGYPLTQTHRDGRFEIEGVSQDIINTYSKRRQAIEAHMDTLGTSSAKAAEMATLVTRPSKALYSPDVYHAALKNEAAKIAPELIPLILKAQKTVLQKSVEPSLHVSDKAEDEKHVATRAVRYAMTHVSENEAVFTHEEMLRVALAVRVGAVTLKMAEKALLTLQEKGEIIALPKKANAALQHYTTAINLKMEKANIRLMKDHQKCLASLVPSLDWVKSTLDNAHLTRGQEAAAKLILTTQDRIVGIQGYAGTGKTTMLKAVKAASEPLGIVLRGIAPSAAAANQLYEGAGIASQTLARFLIEKEEILSDLTLAQTHQHAEVWIIDEASMVATRPFYRLLRYAVALNCRVVLLGDGQQLGAIEAGKPFLQLQKAGMQAAVMKEIVRQQEGIPLKTAILHSIRGDMENALKTLDGNITAIANKTERLKAVAEKYLTSFHANKTNTLVLTPANRDREIINQHIREELKQEGQLAKDGVETPILVNCRLSNAEKSVITHYHEGDVVRFTGKKAAFPLATRNAYYRIHAVLPKKHTLVLETPEKNHITWKLTPDIKTSQGIEVYRPEVRELLEGETIRWTRNDKKRGIINAETATVMKRTKQQATLQLADGRVITCNMKAPINQHWDYAYVSTVYAAQGKTADWVIAHDDMESRQLSDQKSFYVTISRARYGAALLLDDRQDYENHLKRTLGEKSSALEWLEKRHDNTQRNENNKTPGHEHDEAPTQNHEEVSHVVNVNQNSKMPKPVDSAKQSAPRAYYDLIRLQVALELEAEAITKMLLGEPNAALSNAKQLRYGNKGSLVVTLKGQRRGLWHDFETGEGGHLLNLMAKTKGLSLRDAIQEAARLTQTPAHDKPVDYIRIREERKDFLDNVREITMEDKKAMCVASRLWRQSTSIEGTLAERYLEKRGLTAINDKRALRFLPACWHPIEKKTFPALLVKAERGGHLEAVQRIYLDPNTGQKAAIAPAKMTTGRLRFGAGVWLQKGQDNQLLCLAEGPETALSIASALPDATVVASLSLSNMKNVSLDKTYHTILFCADNDNGKEDAKTKLTPALEALSPFAKNIAIAVPKHVQRDFNDVLCQDGLVTVKGQLYKALSQARPTPKALRVDFEYGLHHALNQKEKNRLLESVHEKEVLSTKTVTHEKRLIKNHRQPPSIQRAIEKHRTHEHEMER